MTRDEIEPYLQSGRLVNIMEYRDFSEACELQSCVGGVLYYRRADGVSTSTRIEVVNLTYTEQSMTNAAIISLVVDAITNSYKLDLEYTDGMRENTTRTIKPTDIRFTEGRWTITGFCELKQDVMEFRFKGVWRLEKEKEKQVLAYAGARLRSPDKAAPVYCLVGVGDKEDFYAKLFVENDFNRYSDTRYPFVVSANQFDISPLIRQGWTLIK